jgi:hypothetical protein
MKRKSLLAWATLLAAFPVTVHAAADEPAEKDEPAAAKSADPILSDLRQRELNYLAELRRTVNADVKMTDEQREAVLGHFKKHAAFLEEYTPKPASAEEEKKRQEQRLRLRRELREALQAGNRQRAADIAAKMRELERHDPLLKATDDFHAAVASELNEEQQLAFTAIVRKIYRHANPMKQRARGIRDMRRALDFLDLTPAQNDAIRARYREALAAFGREGHDPEKAKAITDRLKDGILEELLEEQRKAFLDRLKSIEDKPEPLRPPGPHPGNRGRRVPAGAGATH